MGQPSMCWIHLNRQLGACLALFALTLQLVLSFGHIHVKDLGLVDDLEAVASRAHSASGDDTQAPQHRDDDADGVCAICTTLSLSATALLPVIAWLALRIDYEWEWPADIQTAKFVFDLKSYYQARAPPCA
jgi:hypothetical protein